MSKNSKIAVWIGVDVGTTGVRAIAYDTEGKRQAYAEGFYPLLTPHPSWAEQDPREIYKTVKKVIKEAVRILYYKNIEVLGIAFSTVMHSFAGLDKDKKPIMYMQTWADSRSADIAKKLRQDEVLSQNFYEKTCCPIHACYPLAKLLWLKENRPDTFEQMKYIGSLKDYLFQKFTDEWCIDHSTASTSGFYNVHTRSWDEEILAFAGVKKSYLPPIVPTTYQGHLSAKQAEELHLPIYLPVVIGATDGVLVNIGIGAVEHGQLSATIGTSGAMRMLTPEPLIDKKRRTWCYNLTEDIWVVGGAINNGGMILRWLRDKVCHYNASRLEDLAVDPYDLMTLKAKYIRPGSDGLIMLPFLTGERAPYWNSELRGMFFGLSLNHDLAHMIRASMEGICYSLNSVFRILQDFGNINDIRISGSFTKSPLWVQMLADILKHDLVLTNNNEGAAFGAAALGFLASGLIKNIGEMKKFSLPKQIFLPNQENAATYDALYAIFSSLYEKLEGEFASIYQFQQKLD